jgi:RNA polymerase subunit RPABC4/transcription elongation factor Spt4
MGALTEPGLDELIARGCPACGARKLVFRSYLDGRLPVAGGEPVGVITWVYDGEKFVDGVFEVTCAECKHAVFADDRCPRCHAPAALPAILATPNRWAVPAACPACGGEEVAYLAMLPGRVVHDGQRAEKARTSTELLDPGLHGYRVDCSDCGTVDELKDQCPLCAAPGPLRPRP